MAWAAKSSSSISSFFRLLILALKGRDRFRLLRLLGAHAGRLEGRRHLPLPRTTYDQVDAGTTVPVSQAQPGDLVFFYDDVTHVGLYIGNGIMIHAPKPGAYVREESVYYDGESAIHSIVRPA
ncbi:hypothetical protein STENM223S_08431 [Streptomyces tendae]